MKVVSAQGSVYTLARGFYSTFIGQRGDRAAIDRRLLHCEGLYGEDRDAVRNRRTHP
jgi:hypothetical protein